MATPQEMLDEAIAARHAIATGKARVLVRMGDRQIEYTRATLGELNAYISDLQAQIAGTRKRTFRVTQTGTGL